MPRVSKLGLQPLDWRNKSVGQHVAHILFTQVELAGKIGIGQTLCTGYENDRLRLTSEMAVRFAKPAPREPRRNVFRRLEEIEERPGRKRTAQLGTLDTFLAVAASKTARRAGGPGRRNHG